MKFKNSNLIVDKISKHYFEQNFGTFSKSDMDLLMFHFYLDELIEQNSDKNGVVSYSAISDFKIAKELGITPQRVRNLKIKTQLVYPNSKFEWKKSLENLLKDEKRIFIEGNYIKINIPDPNLYLEIQDNIEDFGGFIDIQLNSKLLSIRKECFIELIKIICDESEAKKLESKISEEFDKLPSEIKQKDAYDKWEQISIIVKNSVSSVTDIVNMFNPGGAVFSIINTIVKFLSK